MFKKFQRLLKDKNLDGWLLYDFHGSNPLARKFLKIPNELVLTRPFFYWIPKEGKPEKIVHRIESEHLNFLPGNTHLYLSSKELRERVKNILHKAKTVAMEYSPGAAIPTLSLVDAGTFEMVSAAGVNIESSGELLLPFISVLTLKEIKSHQSAAAFLQKAVSMAWDLIRREKGTITDYEIQQFLLSYFTSNKYESHHAPICAVNADSALPHFTPTEKEAKKIRPGDFVLIDLWCKKKGLHHVFADITRVGFVGVPTKKHYEIFEIVKTAQEKAIQYVVQCVLKKHRVTGADVDDVCRNYIEKQGYGDFFTHRTGHSIDTQLHGLGPNIDNFETEDKRALLKGMCFSIEPGIYLPNEFGVRLETDVLIDLNGNCIITGGLQQSIEIL